jgi:hypothetical protein
MTRRYSLLRNVSAALLAAALALSCASNPATGGRNVVFTSMQGEIEQSRRWYDEIVRFYGIYEDQAVQEYVNATCLTSTGRSPSSTRVRSTPSPPAAVTSTCTGACWPT